MIKIYGTNGTFEDKIIFKFISKKCFIFGNLRELLNDDFLLRPRLFIPKEKLISGSDKLLVEGETILEVLDELKLNYPEEMI